MIKRLLRRILIGPTKPRPKAVVVRDIDEPEDQEIDMTKLNVKKIKTEIRLLARALREHNAAFKQAQREKRDPYGLEPSEDLLKELEEVFQPEYRLRQFRSRYGNYWMWGAVAIYFTRLCALRASMRGKRHFSPNTRPETMEDLGLESTSLEDQREWAECIAEPFELKDAGPEVRVAG